MRKSSYLVITLILLICAGCAIQTIQETDTPAPAPTLENTPTEDATVTTIPTPTPTQASQPTEITISDRYPRIISSSDLVNPVVSIDPRNPQRIAYCAPGEIRVSSDAGQTWEVISTTAASTLAQAQGYILFYGEPGSENSCLSVSLDPNHGNTYYAVFSIASEEYGAPPVFYMGFFTPDGGETWQLVEPPASATIEDFGGFWNLGPGSVQALFFPAGSWDQAPGDILITETADGGLEWQTGVLTCPSNGPCLRWGPAPSNIPGMGSPLPQSIYTSNDAGNTWSTIDPPVELRAPAPNQLVSVSDSEIMILSGGITLSSSNQGTPPLRISHDAGETWEAIQLPPLATEDVNPDYYPGLQYLPNHTYLTQTPEQNTWYWLSPEMPIWCPVNTDRLPSYPVLLQSAGDQIWWVDLDTQQAKSISISELSCAVE
jgi:hypothetical protein